MDGTDTSETVGLNTYYEIIRIFGCIVNNTGSFVGVFFLGPDAALTAYNRSFATAPCAS